LSEFASDIHEVYITGLAVKNDFREDTMSKKLSIILMILVFSLLLSACKPKTELANPASEYCEENGGKVEIREDESGGQVGYCVFPDGSECEEWAYMRGECEP
jgi:putative hemolysin